MKKEGKKSEQDKPKTDEQRYGLLQVDKTCRLWPMGKVLQIDVVDNLFLLLF